MHTCVHKYTILVIMPYACTTLHVHRDMMYFNGVELSDALDDFNGLHVEQVNVIAERLTHQLHPHRHINIHAYTYRWMHTFMDGHTWHARMSSRAYLNQLHALVTYSIHAYIYTCIYIKLACERVLWFYMNTHTNICMYIDYILYKYITYSYVHYYITKLWSARYYGCVTGKTTGNHQDMKKGKGKNIGHQQVVCLGI